METRREIVVGLSISLTGNFSFQGKHVLNALRLWVSHINSQRGIPIGAECQLPVRLIYYDDESRIRIARQNALRLLRDDRVDILLGPYSSSLTMAVAEIAEENEKVLWIHSGSSDDIFTHGFRHLVSTPSPASEYLRGLPHWLAEKMPSVQRICLLHSTKGIFAPQVARGFQEAARSINFHSLEVLPIRSPLRNIDPILRELGSLRPEALVLVASFQDEVRIMQVRHLWPETVKLVAAVAGGVHAFYEELGQGAEGVIGPSQWEPEVRFTHIQGPDSNWFVRCYQERFRESPEYTAAGAFATGLVLAECLRITGSLDDHKLRKVAADLGLTTFYGDFRIDPSTGLQIGHRIVLTQWHGGRKSVLAI